MALRVRKIVKKQSSKKGDSLPKRVAAGSCTCYPWSRAVINNE